MCFLLLLVALYWGSEALQKIISESLSPFIMLIMSEATKESIEPHGSAAGNFNDPDQTPPKFSLSLFPLK